MPLKPGKGQAVVSQNIRELHTGKTYAHTSAKFGKAKANKQAIAIALSNARKYAYGGPAAPKPPGLAKPVPLGGPPKEQKVDLNPNEGIDRMAMRGSLYGLRHEGMINSTIPGRTDKLPMNVKAGSYVLPADIPSALGQGNSMAGGQILKHMFSSGPTGAAMRGASRVAMPRMNFVKPPTMGSMGRMGKPGGFAEGGNPPVRVIPMGVSGLSKTDQWRFKNQPGSMNNIREDTSRSGMTGAGPKLQEDYAAGGTNREQPRSGEAESGMDEQMEHVPIIAAGGEYLIDPAVVRDIGHGDIKAGHRVLDKFVLNTRKKHIDTLKKLKPPKK